MRRLPHDPHALGGARIDAPRGTRSTTTVRNEPIMIIFVGVVVGFVAIALVSAMYGVLNGVQEANPG